jgi:predicted N-acetyltransferase YhbS
VSGAPQAAALLERVLRPGRTLERECPLVFGENATGTLVTVDEQGLPRSGCAVLVREFLVAGRRLRGGLIGSVATDPAWRGRGLASRALRLAEEHLRAEGCLFALLWADDPSFYAARGYAPFGGELDFAIDETVAPSLPAPQGVRSALAADASAIHELYESHPTRVERTADETAVLLQAPRMRTLVLERQGRVRAYACMGRGDDFEHTVHEWGGACSDVLALLSAHASEAGREIYCIAPMDALSLQTELASKGASCSEGILGMGKLLDIAAAARLVSELMPPATSEWTEPSATARIERLPLQELLFPARGSRAMAASLELATGLLLVDLPLRPFAWGLDSI